MIALDTNILVRFLVRDDETQYVKVANLLSELELNQQTAYISLMVLLETNWVLAFSYEFTREQIIYGFLQLFTLPMLYFEFQPKVQQMLQQAQDNNFDLADLMIACQYASGQNLPIITFDKKASKHSYFQKLI